MNKKQQKKLKAIMRKYENAQDDNNAMLCQTAFAISVDKGVWTKDGKPFKLSWHSLEGNRRSSSNVVFYYDSVEDGLVGIKRFKNGKLFAFNDSDFQCEITDADLIAVIEELAPKPTAKENQKPTENKKPVTYMDVFNRVAKFLKANGYNPTTPKDENDKVFMKVGTLTLNWNSVKEFVSAGWGVHGNWEKEGHIRIFNVLSYWKHKYYKLAYPSLRKLVDKVGVLADVDENAVVPVAIMDELNRLKI